VHARLRRRRRRPTGRLARNSANGRKIGAPRRRVKPPADRRHGTCCLARGERAFFWHGARGRRNFPQARL